MQINTDWFLKTGKTHNVCQDYCISGNDERGDYIIVSDGCSSSRMTDIGARILCHEAKKWLNLIEDSGYEAFGKAVIMGAETVRTFMNLPRECLDATLMVSYKPIDSNMIYTFVYGDGCILQRVNGEWKYIEISYKQNAPYYLPYWIDNKKRENYKIEYPKNDIVFKSSCISDLSPDSKIEFISIVGITDLIILSTDGINSFWDMTNKAIPIKVDQEIINSEITGFKNLIGEFLKKRMNKFTEGLPKRNIIHSDDLGMAAMHIKE